MQHCVMDKVDSSGRINVVYTRFRNPSGEDANGVDCDPWVQGRQCDTFLKICVASPTPPTSSNCPTKISKQNADSFTMNIPINPPPFNALRRPYGFYVAAWDNDIGNDDLIDTFSYTFTNQPTPNGLTHWYIPQSNCTKYCIPRNDSRGYYQCDGNGDKVCLTNWYIPQSNCTKYCIPRNDSRGHYQCDGNGGKVCLTNWYIPQSNCTKYCKPRDDIFGHFKCNTTTGDKICHVSWHGQNCTNKVASSGRINVVFTRFQNPSGEDVNGKYCELASKCDTFLKICVASPTPPTSSSCPTKISKQNADSFTMNIPINPPPFNVLRRPYGFYVAAWDNDDLSSDDLIDTFSYTFTNQPTPNGTIPPWTSLSVNGTRTISVKCTLDFKYRIYCDRHYYGQRCDKHCQYTDSDNTGHYRCNNNGDKVCLTHWYIPQSNCTKYCRPRDDIFGHFKCNTTTGDKICHVSWHGQNCTNKAASSGRIDIVFTRFRNPSGEDSDGGYCDTWAQGRACDTYLKICAASPTPPTSSNCPTKISNQGNSFFMNIPINPPPFNALSVGTAFFSALFSSFMH
ncbi:uncharacterized protein LOC116305481 [Actinia tenebrosa]|uniref:Delta-like protein n=1 Tax=Actinia tenebrosa TaxID=6105 RepID=A0A6P8IZB4_ACTTE|nr:uncharacterized protein LOC116305481 [Actinia tenebrosa]